MISPTSPPPRPPPGPSPSTLIIITAALVRLSLSLTALPDLLQDRNELATPITAFSRRGYPPSPRGSAHAQWPIADPALLFLVAVKEGYHLCSHLRLNPYEGGSFHQAPLLLLLGPALDAADPIVSNLVWTGVEVATACLLAAIAGGRNRGIIKGEGEKVWKGWVVAAM